MNPEVFSLSFEELNTKFSPKEKKFKSKTSLYFNEKNSIYPKAKRWKLRCSTDSIQYLEFEFENVNPSQYVEVLNEKFGTFFHFKQYTVISTGRIKRGKGFSYFWDTTNGLAVHLLHSDLSPNRIAIKFTDKFASLSRNYEKFDDPEERKRMLNGLKPKDSENLGLLMTEGTSQKVFELTTNEFQKRFSQNYSANWTSKLKRSARSVTPLQFYDTISNESIFTFADGKLKSLTAMIYNKGDQQFNMTKKKFAKVINDVKSSVEKLTGVKGQFKPNAGIARNHLYWWNTQNYFIKLDASFTQTSKSFSSNYIRLMFSAPVKGINAATVDKISINTISPSELKDMVVREPNGAVYISTVPMVDQGQKGYCACAATARLLNYYGRDIDQHDLAKLANTDKFGTSLEDLKKTLQTISSKLRLHVQSVAKCYLSSQNDVKRFIKKIEREYKKEKLLFKDPFKAKDLKKVFGSMSEKDSRYKDFKKGIIESINGGKPLVWALALGIIPEPEIPQAEGGHMRLIIGYNENTEEIYYTDTWGAGHEKKSMDIKSAFWVSSAIWEVRPR